MEWKASPAPVAYEDAIAFMEARAQAIYEARAPELVWLLEHPPLYTAGTGANPSDLIDTLGLPVFQTGRGGQYTYHGPGQRVAYVMLDLKKRGADVRQYVKNLERWIIATLAGFGIEGFTREGRVGVWVDSFGATKTSEENSRNSGQRLESSPRKRGELEGGRPIHLRRSRDPAVPPFPHLISSASGGGMISTGEAKIAAIGVRIRKWVSYHGISLNVNPDLTHYRGIVPCGIREYGVTSLAALGCAADMGEVDRELKRHFSETFGI